MRENPQFSERLTSLGLPRPQSPIQSCIGFEADVQFAPCSSTPITLPCLRNCFSRYRSLCAYLRVRSTPTRSEDSAQESYARLLHHDQPRMLSFLSSRAILLQGGSQQSPATAHAAAAAFYASLWLPPRKQTKLHSGSAMHRLSSLSLLARA